MSHVTLNLIVIRSADLERAARFYGVIGLTFVKHRHGTGPEHLACEMGSAVFEVYSRKEEADSTSRTRIGFAVPSVDTVVHRLREIGAMVVSEAKDSPWGRRAVVDDFDGHRVEITEAASAEALRALS